MMATRRLIHIMTLLGVLPTGISTICDTQTGTHLDYSHQGLTSLPSPIAEDIVVLDISNNGISILLNNTMEGLSKLRSLDLSYNKIQRLEPLAFNGLQQLCFLDLRGNRLSMNYDSFPLPVFAHVPNLKILHIESNVYPAGRPDITYPDKTLEQLKYLQFFYADTFPGLKLGRGFLSLTSLEEFSSHGGRIFTITNDSLAALRVTKLRKLILNDCGISAIETGAFIHLKYLEVLDLSNNGRLGLEMGLGALYGLQHLNMTDISLFRVNSDLTQLQDSVIDESKLKYFKNMCVANLDLSGNRIVYIDRTFISSLKYPECFRRISLTGNQILSSLNGRTFEFEMILLRRLKYLDISGNFKLPTINKPRPLMVRGDRNSIHFHRIADRKTEIVITYHFLPSSLEVLNVSFGTLRGLTPNIRFKFQNVGNVRMLDMSFNAIDICSTPIYGFGNLTTLNITGCDCSVLSPDFLSRYPELLVLEIQSLRLGMILNGDPDGLFLRHQEKLTSLNMADNGLTYIHRELFSSLRRVQSLNLGNNKFLELPRTLRSMTSLRHLDISFTH